MKKLLFIISIVALLVLVGCKEKDVDTTPTDWCAAGTKTKSSSDNVSAEMIVEGIQLSGKYKGFCHAVWDLKTPEGSSHFDIYFDQEGNGFQVMEVNGKLIETGWTSNDNS